MLIVTALLGMAIGASLALAIPYWARRQWREPDSLLNTYGRWLSRNKRLLAFKLLAQTEPPDISRAIIEGYTASGLPLGQLADSHDLIATGKLAEVAYYASLALHIPLRTTGDLRAVLQKIAP